MRLGVPLCLTLSLSSACGSSPQALIDCTELTAAFDAREPGEGGNILVILTDDIGTDRTGAWGTHPDPPPTPNIDQLVCAGVSFRAAYSNPTCSPSRASLMTGRHATRTGVGRWIPLDSNTWDLQLEELTLAEMLAESPHDYTSLAIGKWHLASFEREDAGLHPLNQGFATHRGMMGNPREAMTLNPKDRGFFDWERNVDGVQELMSTYLTTQTTDDALEAIAEQDGPWFMWLAYNSAHEPLHVPPKELRTLKVHGLSSELKLYNAMVEATDTEIGRLIAGIPAETLANTTIVYMSDNGTPGWGVEEPLIRKRSKGTVYEGGVNVPLVVAGPYVQHPGSSTEELTHFVDLMPTLAEIAGVDLSTLDRTFDGRSILPWVMDPDTALSREVVFTEGFYPSGGSDREWERRTIRSQDWKYSRIIDSDGEMDELLYDLHRDEWDEGDDLLAYGESTLSSEAKTALADLREALTEVDAELEFAY